MKILPVLFTEKVNCCGCMACKANCPVNAIYVIEDDEGFEYPKVDNNRCVGCYKCINVCPLK